MLFVSISVLCSSRTNQPPNLGSGTVEPEILISTPLVKAFPCGKHFLQYACGHIRYSRFIASDGILARRMETPVWFDPRGEASRFPHLVILEPEKAKT